MSKARLIGIVVLILSSLLFFSLYTNRPNGTSLKTSALAYSSYFSKGARQNHCDPYWLLGSLELKDDHAAWRPFPLALQGNMNEDCEPTDWMSAIRDNEEKASIFQGKTIVSLGDSIDRFATRDLCASLSLNATPISWHDPATPIIPAHFIEEEPVDPGHTTHNPLSRPMRCHIPHLDLDFISVFHFGMLTYQELKEDGNMIAYARHFHPPADTIARMDHILIPLMQNLGRKINLFHFSSYLWDADHISRQQGRVNKKLGLKHYPYHTAVSHEAIELYASRLYSGILELSKRIDPVVPMIWRTPHYKVSNETDRVVSEYAVAVARRSASVIRQLSGQLWIQSLDQNHAHDDITAPLYGRLRASGFGEVIHGFEHLSKEGIHPGTSTSEVYGNILLEELARSLGRQ